MAVKQLQSTFPFAWSEGVDVLAAPADIVLPAYVGNDYKACIQPDIEEYQAERFTNFEIYDNVFLEAVRLNCPFADALVVVQPRTELRVYGVRGTFNQPAASNLFIDMSAPWGEWQEVNRFIPFTDMLDASTQNWKWIAVTYPSALTIKTLSLDPAWNGESLKLEVDLKLRYNYPRVP